MEGRSDFFLLAHRASRHFVSVRPARPGQDVAGSDAFKSWNEVWLSGTRIEEREKQGGQLWKFIDGRIVSQGGMNKGLALTTAFIEEKHVGGGRRNDPGVWKVFICNQGELTNSTAQQEWAFLGDGTIRLKSDQRKCLAPAKEVTASDEAETGLTVANYEASKHALLSWFIGYSMEASVPLANKFLGCVLGLAVGDALGCGFEGWAASEIAIMHPYGIRHMSARRDLSQVHIETSPGSFSDRTVMALALAASLVEMRDCVPEHVAQRSAEFFAIKAINGHAPLFGSTAPLLQDMIRDVPGRSAWPAAQFDTFDPVALAYDGCGSCYRAPPVGLAFYTAEDEILREKVCNGVLTAYGDYEGAFMVAKAVALLTQAASPAEFDPEHFLQQLKSSMEGVANEPLSLGYKVASNRDTNEGVWPRTQGQQPSKAGDEWYVDCISDMLAALPRLQQGLSAAALGDVEAAFRFPVHHQQTTPFPGRAVDTVPVALWGFLVRWQTPKEGMAHVLRCGGDTATVGALCGAFLGALHGPDWLSRTWVEQLENGLHGRDFAARTAGQLCQIFGKSEAESEPDAPTQPEDVQSTRA